MNKMKLAALISILVMAGCQANRGTPAPSASDSPTLGAKQSQAVDFQPAGKEGFVFAELDESSAKTGYVGFCRDLSSAPCFGNPLPYAKYVGMQGYFEQSKPLNSDSTLYEHYPIVLENGEKFIFSTYGKTGGKFTSAIIPIELHKQIDSFTPEPLVAGATTQIVATKLKYGVLTFTLSNGDNLSESELKLIHAVCHRFGDKPEIAELLLGMNISKDDVEYRFFVTPKGHGFDSPLELYIGFNKRDVWLRFKARYYDDDWLFVDSFKVAADDYRWQSPYFSFERDHSSGSVWEWVDLSASIKHIEAARALAKAETAIIRFQGKQYYSDKKLTEDQKRGLGDALKLFELMKRGPSSNKKF